MPPPAATPQTKPQPAQVIVGVSQTPVVPVKKEAAAAQHASDGAENGDGHEFGKPDPDAPPFVPSKGLTSEEAHTLLAKWGRNELAEKRKSRLKILIEQFTAPMPMMIWVAIAIEAAILNWPDFGILLALQFINGSVGYYETTKAGDAVAALKKTLKPHATCKRDGKWETIDAGLLVPGDLVVLASGSAVPADCRVNEGRIEVDQSALTGESLPVTMVGPVGQPKMGSTVTRGEVEATVEFTGAHTFFGKTAAMIQSVEGMSHFQKVLLKIMFFLLAVSFVLCGVILVYLLARLEKFVKALSYVVVLLVASIPLAIEVVTTTTMAIGSRELAAGGTIVARLAAIEELAGMNMLCSDKTGTLTLNKMVIQEETPVFKDGMTQSEVLRMAALAAKWHEPPKDALDTLVLGSADLKSLDGYVMLDYMPFDPIEKRTEGTIKGPGGEVFKTTKGAPHVIAKLCRDPAVHSRVTAVVDAFAERGIRSLAVARSKPGTAIAVPATAAAAAAADAAAQPPTPAAPPPAAAAAAEPNGAAASAAGVEWEMLGILSFLDPPRPGTKEVLMKALEFGIDVKMITGDHVAIAKETCRQLGLGSNILNADGLPTLDKDGKPPKDLHKLAPVIIEADGFAQVFPEHKFLIVEALRLEGFAVGMTGDGVNDAPALKKADIGVAVQGATDAARAAADIVLTAPGLGVIIDAITVSRCIFQRIHNFVLYRVACTLQLLVFFFIAVLAFHPRDYAVSSSTRNAVLHTAESGWRGDSRDGVLIGWHSRDCTRQAVFIAQEGSSPSASAQLSPPALPAEYGPAPWLGAGWLGDGRDVSCVKQFRRGRDEVFSGTAQTAANASGSWPLDSAEARWLVPGWECRGAICVERWDTYFKLPVIALIIITLLNDGTIITIAYDHVKPSKFPEKWNLKISYLLSGVLGGVACASSILILHLTLDSHNQHGTWHQGWGLPELSYGAVVACLYLKVSLSDFLTLFAARTTRFFFAIRPARALLLAAVVALGCSTLLAAFWPFNEEKDTFMHGFGRGGGVQRRTHPAVLGVIWLYVFIWWIIQDCFKYAAYVLLEKFDFLHHKTAMFVNARGSEGQQLPRETQQLAIGLVENKLVAARARDASATLTTVSRASQDHVRPKLEELEAALRLRNNEREVAARADDVAEAVHSMSAEERKLLRQHAVALKLAAQRAAVAGSVRERYAGGEAGPSSSRTSAGGSGGGGSSRAAGGSFRGPGGEPPEP